MAEKEYIEREAAIEAVKKERNYTGKFTFEEEHAWAVGFQQGITFALSDIATIPAADVRPVVLCRDCKNDCHCMIQDFMEDYGVTHDDQNNFFCGYGEREEEEAVSDG